MSHRSVVKTRVSRFDRETLLGILKSLEEVEICSVGSVADRYVTITAPILIKHKLTGRYIGVNPETGEILGDPFGWSSEFNKIVNTIVQRYIATVLVKKLQKLGYNNIQIQKTDKAIVGIAMRWG